MVFIHNCTLQKLNSLSSELISFPKMRMEFHTAFTVRSWPDKSWPHTIRLSKDAIAWNFIRRWT